MKLKLDLAKLPLPTGKTVISYSELKDWIECSFRHKLKYILNLGKFEASENTIFGNAIHSSCEDYIKTREMKPEIALSILAQGWSDNKFKNLGIWLEKANKILDVMPGWLEEVFPGWSYVDAEELLTESIPDSTHENVKFKGYIDAVIKHGNYYHLLDWKSSTGAWNTYKRGDPLIHLQLILYNLFWSIKHNIPSNKIKCGFVIFSHGDEIKERGEYINLPVSEDQKKQSLIVLNNMISSVKRQAAFKAWKRPEGLYQGVCMFCEFNGTEYCPTH